MRTYNDKKQVGLYLTHDLLKRFEDLKAKTPFKVSASEFAKYVFLAGLAELEKGSG